jgi:GAG-pre-integrase domain
LPFVTGDERYLDSGATHHVTNNLNNLSSFLPYVHVGNGVGMIISHIGSIILCFSDYTISLKNVLFVPSFTKNLVSLSQLLHDSELLIEFSSDFCEIKDRLTLRTLLRAKLIKGLYPLHLPVEFKPQVFLRGRVPMDVWHARFGHPSSLTTHKILVLNFLPSTNNKMSLCHHFILAKAHRLSFLSSTSSFTYPLEIIYSDVWGPTPLLSRNGFRYYIIFVDDYSRYSWIYFLCSKDEVIHVFTSFKLQVENFLQQSIKILRADEGTEYKHITRLFPSIIHQTTCPYTPQQNGVSERKHRHIIELALAVMIHASLPMKFWDDIFTSVVYLVNRQPPSSEAFPLFFKLFHK